MTLDERKQQILRAITIDYITTAEPVGSRAIAKKYGLGVSSATIRNEMSDLEESGYLQQPHTSAGRVPSDKGYRFYVDVLMDPFLMSEAQETEVRANLERHQREFDLIMHHASRFLTLLTDYTSIVFGPLLQVREIRHLQLVPMDVRNVLIVVVTSPEFVENRVCRMSRSRTVEELANLSVRLTEILKGQKLGELSRSVRESLAEAVTDPTLLQALEDMLAPEREMPAESVHVEGTASILRQPEFRDIDKVRSFMSLFEGKNMLADLMAEATMHTGVNVKIGQENEQGELVDCGLVTASYNFRGHPIGTIGVVGPKRMEYSRAVGVVRFVAECMSEILDRLGV